MKYDNSKIIELYEIDMPNNVRNDIIFKKTYHLVPKITKKYRKYTSYLDITQDGLLALFGAIKSFNPKACPRFYGWAFLYVKRAVGRAAYRHKLYDEKFHLVASSGALVEEESSNRTPEDTLFNTELCAIIEKASNCLGKDTNYIIKTLFGLGDAGQQTILELQDKNNLSKHRIRKIRDQGLRQLRINLPPFEVLI